MSRPTEQTHTHTLFTKPWSAWSAFVLACLSTATMILKKKDSVRPYPFQREEETRFQHHSAPFFFSPYWGLSWEDQWQDLPAHVHV